MAHTCVHIIRIDRKALVLKRKLKFSVTHMHRWNLSLFPIKHKTNLKRLLMIKLCQNQTQNHCFDDWLNKVFQEITLVTQLMNHYIGISNKERPDTTKHIHTRLEVNVSSNNVIEPSMLLRAIKRYVLCCVWTPRMLILVLVRGVWNTTQACVYLILWMQIRKDKGSISYLQR